MPALKPPRGQAKINYGSRLARNLLAVWIANEGGGEFLTDLVNPGLQFQRNNTTSDWRPTPHGIAPHLNRSGGDYYSLEERGNPKLDLSNKSWSVMVLHRPSDVTNDTTLVGWGGPSGGTRNIMALAMRIDGQMLSVTFYNDDADFFLPSAYYMQVGRTYAHAVTFDATTNRLDLYQDGMFINGQTMGGSPAYANPKWRIGKRTDDNWSTYDGDIIAVYLWDTKLSSAAVARVSGNPFALVTPPQLLRAPSGPTTYTATASPTVAVSTSASAKARRFATASPTVVVSTSAASLARRFATATPTVTVATSPIVTRKVPTTATPTVTVTTSPTTVARRFATATPTVTVTTTPSALARRFATTSPTVSVLTVATVQRKVLATATPTVTVSTSASTVARRFATATPTITVTTTAIAEGPGVGDPPVLTDAKWGGGGSHNTLSATLDTVPLADDIVIALVYRENNTDETITWDTTPLSTYSGSQTLSSPDIQFDVASFRANGIEDNYGGSWATPVYAEILLITVRGCPASGDPIDIAGSFGANGSNATTVDLPSVTTTEDNDTLIAAYVSFGGGAWTPPSGMTEFQDTGVFGVASEERATAGATGTRTPTRTGGGSSTAHIGVLFAAKAAVVGGPTFTVTSPITLPLLQIATTVAEDFLASSAVSLPVAQTQIDASTFTGGSTITTSPISLPLLNTLILGFKAILDANFTVQPIESHAELLTAGSGDNVIGTDITLPLLQTLISQPSIITLADIEVVPIQSAIVATVFNPAILDSDINLPRLNSDIAVHTTTTGFEIVTSPISLPLLQVSSTGGTNSTITSAVSLPMLQTSIQQPNTITGANLSVPAIQSATDLVTEALTNIISSGIQLPSLNTQLTVQEIFAILSADFTIKPIQITLDIIAGPAPYFIATAVFLPRLNTDINAFFTPPVSGTVIPASVTNVHDVGTPILVSPIHPVWDTLYVWDNVYNLWDLLEVPTSYIAPVSVPTGAVGTPTLHAVVATIVVSAPGPYVDVGTPRLDSIERNPTVEITVTHFDQSQKSESIVRVSRSKSNVTLIGRK